MHEADHLIEQTVQSTNRLRLATTLSVLLASLFPRSAPARVACRSATERRATGCFGLARIRTYYSPLPSVLPNSCPIAANLSRASSRPPCVSHSRSLSCPSFDYRLFTSPFPFVCLYFDLNRSTSLSILIVRVIRARRQLSYTPSSRTARPLNPALLPLSI